MKFLRGPLSLLLVALATAAGALVAASPAQAAPAQVSPPWVKGSTPTSLTLDWPSVSGASRYQVFIARSRSGVESSKAKSRIARSSTIRISGLKPKSFYCFKVRALRGSSKGKRSATHCKLTSRRTIVTNPRKVETFWATTYNICSAAKACQKPYPFARRLPGIIDSIKRAKPDVLALQESSAGGKAGRAQVTDALARLGYARAGYENAKSTYYRTSRFTQAGDYQYVALDSDAEALAVDLVSRSTKKRYRFVNIHLKAYNDSVSVKQREQETRRLLAWMNATRGNLWTGRIVLLGDFNSHRNHGKKEHPRILLNRSGWYDTYDRSGSYYLPQFNSGNRYIRYPNFSTNKSSLYGAHLDKVMVQDAIGSAGWRVVHRFDRGGKYLSPLPSDHVPVTVKLYAPR